MTRIEALRETIDKLVFKYNIRREYFTIVLPVLLGIALILAAFLTGHTLTEQQQSHQVDEKLKAYEELVRQLNESGNSSFTIQEQSAQPAAKADLDHYIIYGIIIALIPYSIDRFFERRRHRQYEDDFTQFLFKLSEMMRAGIDPIKSVIELSKTDLGSITPNIRMAASMMLLGRSFEEGMRKMADSLHSEMVSKYVDLVIQASYMGGSVHDLILKASEDMRTMIMIEKEMLGNLQQYTVIFYLAQAIIIFIAYILSAQLIPFIQGPGATFVFGAGDLQKIDFTQSFFHLVMINAALGGIIIGKISEGSIKDGIKHVVILMSASYLISVFVILPLAIGSDNYIITAVSGDNQTGMAGFKLDSPIIFNVTDKGGHPVPDTQIQFEIKPDGKVEPAFTRTDNSSQATVKVTLGQAQVDYTVTAKIGSSTGSVKIKIREPTGG